MTMEILIHDIGWTLAHSVWQFALVFGFLWAILKVVPREKANLRYAVSVFVLGLILLLPVATFWKVSRNNDLSSRVEPAAYSDFEQVSGESDSATTLAISNQAPSGIASTNQSSNTGLLSSLNAFAANQLPAIFPFAVALWLAGVGIFSVRLGGGIWQLRNIRRHCVEPPAMEWQARFEAILCKLQITGNVVFARSNALATPIAIGIVKPIVLVPAGLFLQIDPRELESIIAHELIHVRRHDALVSFVQGITETLFFYHPCVWWISKQLDREREFAADAAVIEAFADDQLVYANALANLEEIRLRANTNVPSLAAAADGGNLMQRIERILQNKTETRSTNSAWSAGLALALISALLLVVFSFTPGSSVNAQLSARGDRKIAIGFVGIPPVDRSEDPPKDADATARLVIAKLQQYKVPAIGFLTGSSVSDGDKLYPVRANIVRLWRDAGLEVGIGNFRHVWFYETPYDEFVAGVEKNEAVANRILGEKNLKLRYFSYPYLNTGRSVDERDRFEQWLRDQGLSSVKYTVDNQEWMYSYAYDMARNDNDVSTMNEVRIAFIKYMDQMMSHYEAYSKEMFGRDIAQTMVLTPSRLVADSADELFGMLQKRGYRFVPMDEAQADEAYKTPETMVGKFGNSWFERWTQTQGRKLRDEPNVAPVVSDIWQKRKPAK